MISLKVNAAIGGKAPGQVIQLETDNDGVIIDDYWRARFIDAQIDGCVEIVSEPIAVKTEEPKKKKD